jgi:hypothetical protein
VLLPHPVVVVSPAVAGWAVLRVVTGFPVLVMRWSSSGLPRSPECRGLLRFQRSLVADTIVLSPFCHRHAFENRRPGCDYSIRGALARTL